MKTKMKSTNLLGIFVAFVMLCAILAIASPAFLKATNFLNILQQISINFTIAIGMTFVIIIGGIDLSVGSIAAITGMFVALLMKDFGMSVGLSLLVAMIGAGALGLLNGIMVAYLDLPPFIATLGMMGIARGASYSITAGQPIYSLPKAFLAISERVAGIPLVAILIMAVLFALASYTLKFTRFGRHVYAVGGQRKLRQIIRD